MSLTLADADACGWAVAWVLLLFALLGAAVVWTANRRGRGLRAVVARYGGTIERDTESTIEVGVRFEVEGRPAWLEGQLGGEGESTWTRLELTSPGDLTLSVDPRGLFDFASASSEGEQVGDAEFDRRFRVTCTPAGRASALLDADARRLLLELHDLGAGLFGKGVRFTLGPRGASVHVPRDLVRDRDALVGFVDRSLALVRRLRPPG